MKTNRSILYWSADLVRFHDVENGRWTDVYPRPSELSAIIWCTANNVNFKRETGGYVAVSELVDGRGQNRG